MKSPPPLVIAHRGFSARFPENTLAAVRAALALRVDYVEIDVQQTRDGQLIVFHDYRLNRLCGVPGRVRDHTLTELRRWKPDVPTLAQVLRACRDRAGVLIEIKGADPRAVAALIARLGMEKQVIVFSINARRMEQFAAAAPRIPRFALIARNLKSQISNLKLSVSGLGLGRHLVTARAVVNRVHRRGWRLFVWTVNRPAEMRRLIAWGVDGLITNHPDRALDEVRGQRSEIRRLKSA